MGHHWSYIREQGEPQITVNYCKALSDFVTNFTFSRGVSFRSPGETSAIVPALLDRVWTVDNEGPLVFWEMGQQGGVTGDCFVKVAYEEPRIWPADEYGQPIAGVPQRFIPGKVRVLVLNSAHCFPEWYPHDRTRLMRFKQKYRFWGNTPDGARSVFTYTELMTETSIQEYVNDVMINERPNPLGMIPVVHIPNTRTSGTPWGSADIADILTVNRTYNEVMTDVVDIVNYHAAPVTVIVGANINDLEKGANKTWGGLPENAQVYNLEGGGQGLVGAMELLDRLKKIMHEMTGVPEGALGDAMPVSNTSGVALAITYQPLMNRYNQKKINYGTGFQRVNELILRTLALKEPETFIWTADQDEELKEGQLAELDPEDPITYRSECHWPPPLPVDKVVLLNEIMMEMNLGLESKEGAWERLGEVFPSEKQRKVFLELVEDAIDQGALDMLRAQIAQAIGLETGMMAPNGMQPMDPGAGGVQSAGGGDVTSAGSPSAGAPGQPSTAQPMPMMAGPADPAIVAHLQGLVNTRAYGTKLAQWRNPTKNPDADS
jgi:hypothetical protein